MRRILLVLCLLGFFSGSQQQKRITSIECPIPDTGSTPDEATCLLYPACAWDVEESVCHMDRNDVAGYIIASAPVMTAMGYTVTLTKIDNTATLFNGDIETLEVQIINHEDDHLQVKIIDPANARYEVPMPLNLPSASGTNPLYNVEMGDVGDYFVLKVTRKSTGTEIFKSSGPLTYEDQFIQITTELPSTYLYGIGENTHQTLMHDFNQRTTWALFARDQPVVSQNVNNYGVHPYYLNIEDDAGNTHSVHFVNSNAMEYATFSMDRFSTSYPALTMRTIGGIVDLHMYLGPTPEEVNIHYHNTIGNPELPPYWALGFQLSRYGYGSSANYTVVRDRMRAAGIPQDVQVFDIDYMDRYRDFTYDPTNWGDLPQIIDELHAENIKVILILDPAIAVDTAYSTYANGRAADVFIKWEDPSMIPTDQLADADDYLVGYVWPEDKTVFPDFWKNETLTWWTNELIALHDMLPYDGIWIDMNEPANFGTDMARPWNYPAGEPDWSLKCPVNSREDPPYPTKATTMDENESGRLSDKTICMSSVQTDGINTYSHYDVHNLYGYKQTIVTELALETVFPGWRPAVLSRSTYPGSGIAAIHWLGDNTASWEQLKTTIIGVIEFNMFGIPMVGADVCGFFGEPSEELCIRWMQLGAFCPFDRNHNSMGEPDQDPARPDWADSQVYSKEVLLLRYEHLPFFYAKLHMAHMRGYSAIRALFATFPSDLAARGIDDQFMWADYLMVAPVITEGAINRDVYFPQSLWYSLYDGTLVSSGNETLLVDAPLNVIPVFIRGGSIVPTQTPGVTTTLSLQNNFTFSVALDDTLQAYGDLYMDDTVSYMSMPETYLADITYNVNQLTLEQQHLASTLQGKFLEQVNFYGFPSAPISMTLNGVNIDSSSWVYDIDIKVMQLYLSHELHLDFIIYINY